jgi:colanic acid biosynthesis protein WcaH
MVEGNDGSLFYDADVKALTMTSSTQKFLPSELYAQMVRDCIICCVDCIIVRASPISGLKECLLVERGTEPVKGTWWWPGGRMYKGETFFDGAVRKTREETGLGGARPIQILGFWNTFFPTSQWDSPEQRGTQTVQPIILVELTEGSEVLLDDTSERYRWISLCPDEAVKNEEDKYVVEGLRRLNAWNATYGEEPLLSA